jgi:Na+-driven multidrug efflux pump
MTAPRHVAGRKDTTLNPPTASPATPDGAAGGAAPAFGASGAPAPAPGAPAAGARAPGASVLRLAAPLVVSFWMRSLFTFVDTVYASTLGDAAIAAIGLTIPLEFLMIACWVGVSNGFTSTLSQALGARQGARIAQLTGATRRIIRALVPLFALIAAASWFAAPRLGLEAGTARQFAIYAAVLIGGSAFTAFWSIVPDSIVKAHHDTRSTMWAGIWSNLINVGLNTLFTFVFHWGIFGIAFSTVLGRFGGLIYAQRKAAAHEAARQASGLDTDPGLDPAPMRSILALAVPGALSYGLMALETLLINWLLAARPDSTNSIAAYGIYYRVLLFAVMPIIAASVAVLPFVARRYGERDLPAIRKGLRQVNLAALLYCLVLVTPALLLGGGRVAVFLAEVELTADLTRVALWICPLVCLASIPFFLCRPAFEGLQRGRPGLLVAILRYVVLTGPCAWAGMVLAARLQAPALYGLLAGLVVATALSSLIFQAWLGRALRDLEARFPARVADGPAARRG